MTEQPEQAESPATEHSAGQDSAGQDSAGQHSAGQDSAGQHSAGQQRAGERRTGQQRAGEHSAGNGPASGGRTGSRGRQTGGGRSLGEDLASDFQRWLIRSGASSMRREFGEHVRRTLGGGRAETSEVWETATTEPPADEEPQAPECAWCPICKAARRIRTSGPGLGAHLSGASDAVASAVQEALSAFDAVLSANPAGPPKRPAARPDEGLDSEPDDRR